jgi:hypothetical protein
MFASDRDLLGLEPNLFRDVGWVSQRLAAGAASVSGTVLTLTAGEPDFEQAGVGEGDVALFDGAACEVLARLSAVQLSISRLRASPTGPALPPSPGTNRAVVVSTFAPQIRTVEDQVLRMLGIEPGDPFSPGVSDIVNPGALRLVVCLGALHLIHAAAEAPAGGDEGPRTAMYRKRFAAERQRVAVGIDLDGDGMPDAIRRINHAQFVRA